MISSAPARRDTKLAILEHFRNSQLFELYGSTEAGWVTLLRPDEQIDPARLGRPRMDRLRADQAARSRRPRGARRRSRRALLAHALRLRRLLEEPGEDGRGASAARWCSVGDMARRDADGYIHLVDRKSNMIISGGENVYPSRGRGSCSARIPACKDVAVVGVPHDKWGEAVHAVVVLHAGRDADRGRGARLVPRPDRRLQAAALGLVHRRGRDAAHRDRQDPAPAAARPLRALTQRAAIEATFWRGWRCRPIVAGPHRRAGLS